MTTSTRRPIGWTPHMKLLLIRHLRVVIAHYEWGLKTPRSSEGQKRVIAKAKTEAEEVLALLEG